MFFLIFVHVTFLRVLYNNIHHHIAFAKKKKVLVRPVIKRIFFPWKTKEKKARFACAPHGNIIFYGPTIYIMYILRFYGPYDTYV